MHQPSDEDYSVNTQATERRWQVGDAAFLIDWPHGRRCGIVEIVGITEGKDDQEWNAFFTLHAGTPILDHGSDRGRGSFHDPGVLSRKVREEGEYFSANYYQLEKPRA